MPRPVRVVAQIAAAFVMLLVVAELCETAAGAVVRLLGG